MFTWLKEYGEANPQTKYFVLNGLIYGLAIIITTLYCYGRLDFVRSYPTPSVVEAEQKAVQQKNSTTTPKSQAIK